mmetsp:Transcript_23375/g.73158  ORF Transcript_23375/g.73158 Transcript_23375/m.73158 type:complete len:291 (+) Transcript_23375:1353-2225(+)
MFFSAFATFLTPFFHAACRFCLKSPVFWLRTPTSSSFSSSRTVSSQRSWAISQAAGRFIGSMERRRRMSSLHSDVTWRQSEDVKRRPSSTTWRYTSSSVSPWKGRYPQSISNIVTPSAQMSPSGRGSIPPAPTPEYISPPTIIRFRRTSGQSYTLLGLAPPGVTPRSPSNDCAMPPSPIFVGRRMLAVFTPPWASGLPLGSLVACTAARAEATCITMLRTENSEIRDLPLRTSNTDPPSTRGYTTARRVSSKNTASGASRWGLSTLRAALRCCTSRFLLSARTFFFTPMM